jgi:hypothetical protein
MPTGFITPFRNQKSETYGASSKHVQGEAGIQRPWCPVKRPSLEAHVVNDERSAESQKRKRYPHPEEQPHQRRDSRLARGEQMKESDESDWAKATTGKAQHCGESGQLPGVQGCHSKTPDSDGDRIDCEGAIARAMPI